MRLSHHLQITQLSACSHSMRYSLASIVGMATTFFRYFLFHVMASRCLSSSEHKIRQLLEEKDSKNTKRKFFRYHVYFLRLQCIIKRLSDSVFVISKIINVSVRVICLALGSADSSYLDIDNSAYHCKTSSNNCLLSNVISKPIFEYIDSRAWKYYLN